MPTYYCDNGLKNCLRVIRNARLIYYALIFLFKVVYGVFCIALHTP
ncbi:TPA: DUF3265 domain-containing protein [Aeromonas hydrophila]|nr:DUF3265 domain-containing protein [Aeromonas hydrophila]